MPLPTLCLHKSNTCDPYVLYQAQCNQTISPDFLSITPTFIYFNSQWICFCPTTLLHVFLVLQAIDSGLGPMASPQGL